MFHDIVQTFQCMDLSIPTIAYILWGRDEETAKSIASEAAVSILSLKEKSPNCNIHCYIGQSMGFFKEFLNWQNCKFSTIETDYRMSFMTKIKAFIEISKEYDKFWLFDTDTQFKRKIPEIQTTLPIRFASHNLTTRLSAMPKSVLPYFSQYFDVKKQFSRVCSCAIYVDKEVNRKLFNDFQCQLKNLLDIYEQKVDKNNTINPNAKMLFFDEWYFTLALLKLKQDPKHFLLRQKDFHSGGGRYADHAQKIRQSRLEWYYNIMDKGGIDTSFFKYPKRYTKP